MFCFINTANGDEHVVTDNLEVKVLKPDCTVDCGKESNREAALLSMLRQIYLDEMGSHANMRVHDQFEEMVARANAS